MFRRSVMVPALILAGMAVVGLDRVAVAQAEEGTRAISTARSRRALAGRPPAARTEAQADERAISERQPLNATAVATEKGEAAEELRLFDEISPVSFAALKEPIRRERAPNTTYVFAGRELRERGILTLRDLLRRIPGSQVNPQRQGHDVAWFRGVQARYNDKILLVVDGVPVRDYFYGNFLLDEMHPVEEMERVEIVMGPGSVLYGANAFAGVINITTFKQGGEASARYGSHGSAQASARHGAQGLSVFGSRLRVTDGFAPTYGRDGLARRVAQNQDRDLTRFNVGLTLNDALTMAIGRTEYTYPYAYSSFDSDRLNRRVPTTTSLRYATPEAKGEACMSDFEILAYHVHYEFSQSTFKVSKSGAVAPKSAEDEYRDNRYYGVDALWRRHHGAHGLLFGLSLQGDSPTSQNYSEVYKYTAGGARVFDKRLETLAYPQDRYLNYAAYIQDYWALGPDLAITLGGRYDIQDRFDDEVSYRAGLVRSFGEIAVKGLVGTAFRIPSYREFQKLEDGIPAYDTSLKTEHLQTFELALERKTARADLLVTGFYNIYRDYIDDRFVATASDEVYFNFPRLDTRGIEVSSEHWSPGRRVGLLQGLAYTQRHAKGGVTNQQGLSPWSGFAGLRWLPEPRLELGSDLLFASRRKVNADYQSAVPVAQRGAGLPRGYAVIDAHASLQIRPQMRLRLAARNLANVKYASPHFGPSSGYDYAWPGAEFDLSLAAEW